MLLAILVGCVLYNTIPRNFGIEKNLKNYVNIIKQISNGNLDGNNLHINFGQQGDKILGTCYYYRKEIILDKKKWNLMSYNGKILLLAHEIAHCQKKIKHINGLDKWGCALHFMHWQDTGYFCNKYKFKQYVRQMKEI